MNADSPALGIAHDGGRSFAVSSGGVELVRYWYRPGDAQLESPRPYLHPIRTVSGREVSLFRPHDHVWHKGIAWSLPNVGPHNFWGGTTYRRDRGYEQLDNNGSMDHQRVLEASVDGTGATFEHDLLWHTQQGAAIVAERRRLTARLPAPIRSELAGAWLLTFETTISNRSGEPLPFGSPTTEGRDNAGYAGLFWRGPRSFTGGVVLTPDGPGGEEVRGARHPWLGFQGRHDGDGAVSSILMVDDVANIQHPPEWFVRSELYACMNPAPFFSDVFVLDPDASLRLRYAVIVADGECGQERAAALAAWGREVLDEVREMPGDGHEALDDRDERLEDGGVALDEGHEMPDLSRVTLDGRQAHDRGQEMCDDGCAALDGGRESLDEGSTS